MSPTEFETAYRRGFDRASAALARHGRVLLLPALAGLFFLVWWAGSFPVLEETNLARSGGLRWIRLSGLAIPFTVILSLLPRTFLARWRASRRIAALVLIWFFSSRSLHVTFSRGADYLTALLIPAMCVCGWVFLKNYAFTRRKWLSVAVFSLLFWGIPALFFLLPAARDYFAFTQFLYFKPEFIWLTCVAAALDQKFTGDPSVITLNPANAIHGTLWPYDLREEREEKRKLLWWSGMSQLYLGFALLLLRLELGRRVNLQWSQSSSTWLISRYFMLLGDVSGANVFVGLTRIMGYQVRNITYFVFLAKTPAEVWRRVQTFDYLFLLNYVKLPLFRRFRSHFFSILAAFFLFYVKRFDASLIADYVAGSPYFFRNMALQFSTFVGSFLLIYFSGRYWFFSVKERSRPWQGWASVVLTHILSAVVDLTARHLCFHFFSR